MPAARPSTHARVDPPTPAPAAPALAADRIRRSVVHDVIHTITDPWKPGIVLMLWLGRGRFTELVDGLRISRSTLTQRLAQLIEDGCVVRGADDARAPYRLTPKGEGLLGIVLLNRQWNTRWSGGSRLLPGLKLTHECGAPLALQMLCRHCEQEVRARDVKVLQTAAPAAPVSGLAAEDTAPLAYRRARNHRGGAASAAANAALPITAEDLTSDRWTSLVLAMAFLGLRRNSEIEQAIGIAPNILADRLAWLTANGIFDRVPYQWSPERHEYRLSAKGLDRYPVILAMMLWGQQWLAPRPALGWGMLHKPCHEWLAPRLACRACKGDVQAGNVRPAEGA